MSDLLAAVQASAMPMAPEYLPAIEGRVLHLDGDFLAYWCGVIENAGTAKQVALNKINRLMEVAQCSRCVVHLTDEASTKADRYIIAEAKPYQGQRHSAKPQNWQFMRYFLGSLSYGPFSQKTWATREADDGMAYMATVSKMGDCVIAAKDKDMRMLPGLHVDWDTYEIVTVPHGAYDVVGSNGKQYGLKWFWLQVLHGDTADNIPGLPRCVNPKGNLILCGEKTAQRMLKDCATSREAGLCVAEHYELVFGPGWQRKLVEQMLLLWLRTDREASVFNLREVLPLPDSAELFYFDHKIRSAYETADSLTGTSNERDDAG